jgi:asparagine synthase (glutamine-hydrolysing)
MCRLAINDLEGGGQPLFNRDRSVALMYNGEIYNSPALRKDLEARGYAFRTHSDGEVICHLYDEYGEELFERLDGMFAAALWDAEKRRLFLARDLPGEKPLYYAELGGGRLVFASEIKAIRKFRGLDLTLDRQAIWDFPTFLWIPEPSTVFNEIKALPRGHVLCADDGGISVKAYANKFNRGPLTQDDGEIVEETRRVVREAVQSRLLSDVPVGCFLSGGLDSSIVATLATEALGSVDTFSVAFEKVHDPYHGTADESGHAAAYAKMLGSRHHTIRVTAETFHDDLDRFCHHADQPFGVSSGLGILSVARAAREAGIKVLLSGDCADECFGGYSWYVHLPGGKAARGKACVMPVTAETPVSFQNFGMGLAERLEVLAGYDAPTRAWAWHYYAHESEKAVLFSKDIQEGLESSLRHFRAFDAAADWSAETFIAQDRDFYMPQEMLRKVDRMTMAYSVEGRVPFAAPSVLSHADKLPYGSLVRGATLKSALRRAFSHILPAEITSRPKHGFNVPIDHWLKGSWRHLVDEAFAGSSALRRHGLVDAGAGDVVQRMVDDPVRLNGHTIFCYVMLNRWLEGLNG